MMATPIDLDEFGLGFALSEGIVERATDVFDIESECRAGSAEVRLTVSQQAFMAMKAHRRALAGRTGCGVCGIESIAQLDLHPPRIAAAGTAAGIGAAAIERAARVAGPPDADARDGRHPCGRVVQPRRRRARRVRGRRPPQRARQADRPARAAPREPARRLRVPVQPRKLRTGAQGRAGRHPDDRDDPAPTSLAIDVAREAGVRLVGFAATTAFVEYVSPDVARPSQPDQPALAQAHPALS